MKKPKILILGTDAAGKNYVGQLILRQLRAAGLPAAFRERRLSGRDNGGVEKDKSAFGHLAEWAFVRTYPLTQVLMPWVVDILLQLDLVRTKSGEQAEIIVSHTALRLAAFDLGHKYACVSQVQVPARTQKLLRQLYRRLDGDTIVLDIAHATRRQRVQARGDTSDPFDRYLAARPELSERIEACMVHLATEHLDASLIENNDLSEQELLQA
ncbi:MAG: hypothetical protein ACPGSC_14745, partial [Granulosicoccaceae bacterium]